jgi:hypothetical protein
MKKTASEVIHDLEMRIARLERQASRTDRDAYTHTIEYTFTDIILDKNDRAIAKEQSRYDEKGKGYDMDSAIKEALIRIADDLMEHFGDLVYQDDNNRDTIYFYYGDGNPHQIDDFKDEDLEKWSEQNGWAEAELKIKGITKDQLEYFVKYWFDVKER